MSATAGRRAVGSTAGVTNFNSLYTSELESWYNPAKAEEIVYHSTPLWWIFAQNKKTGVFSYDRLVRLIDADDVAVDSFQYDDTVNTQSFKGTQAARFSFANYSAPITISWQEEVENKEPYKLADRVELMTRKAELAFAKRLDLDLHKGNGAKATNILGIEQAIPPFTDSGTLGAHTGRWQYRQATNSYGNITRVAWTSDTSGGNPGTTAGGTGWESLSVDFDANSAMRFSFDSLNGQPSSGLQELLDLYMWCSEGIVQPNFGLWSHSPYRDYELSGWTKSLVTRDVAKFSNMELAIQNIMFKGAQIVLDEGAITQNATGAIGDSTNAEHNAYLFNTDYWEMAVEEGCDFNLGPPRMPVDAHISTRHIIWRGQLICVNPRYQGRIYAYPA